MAVIDSVISAHLLTCNPVLKLVTIIAMFIFFSSKDHI